MEFAVAVLALIVTTEYSIYKRNTGDSSIQGFIKYLKEKFYYKKD
jgi:hypothetical protein